MRGCWKFFTYYSLYLRELEFDPSAPFGFSGQVEGEGSIFSFEFGFGCNISSGAVEADQIFAVSQIFGYTASAEQLFAAGTAGELRGWHCTFA